MRVLVFLISVCLASPSFGADAWVWKDHEGKPAPERPAQKARDGFGGLLLITPDQDWAEKWGRPETPQFVETDSVSVGETISVLIFFANPLLSADRNAKVTCTIDVIRPDGSSSMHQPDAVCFSGEIEAEPSSLYLSEQVIGFIAEESDLKGRWRVQVSLKDEIRGTVIPLETEFVVQ